MYYAFSLRSLDGQMSHRFEDDAETADALGDRVAQMLADKKRLTTFSEVTTKDLEEAVREGTPVDDLPVLGEKIVNASWDPADIIHVFAYDDVTDFDSLDLEGDERREKEDEKKSAAAIRSGGGKKR